MQKLKRSDLYSLEKYVEIRNRFRARVMAHKKNRVIRLGPNATLHFEDRLTVQYQIQEMLRAERIFEADGIEEELAAYNPLIPDGSNWKATLMLEFEDPIERHAWLARLVGIEDMIRISVASAGLVRPIADEDLPRDTPDKTSSVHFLRFELEPEMVSAAKVGAAIAVGVDHPDYRHLVDPVPEPVRASLAGDLD
jgi:hypothetical protein